MAKTVLIPQTTFTATEQSISGSLSKPIGNVNFDEETIKVVFDGVTYSVNRKLDESDPDATFYYYGEDIDNSTEVPTLLFNQYPFRLEIRVYPIATMDVIYVSNVSAEHTIEVYTGEDEPVVTVQKPGVQVLQLDERLIIFDETTGDIVTFDGENWLLGNDGFGESVMPSKYAVVGTAIVGKDVVAPSA